MQASVYKIQAIKLFAIGFLTISAIGLASCSKVDTGERGVETRWGKVISGNLSEGLYFYNPFITTMNIFNIKTVKKSLKTTAYTKDVQTATLEYSINYNLDPEAPVKIIKTVGLAWEDILIPPIVESTIKNVLGKWDALDLVENRAVASQSIYNSIKTQFASNGIVLSYFSIDNVDFSKEFEAAVEAKVIAVQKANQAKNRTIEVQEEANQKLISAKAEAQAMQIKSDALARNNNLIQYEAVHKWDGELPEYMLGNSVPFINIK